jgi:integrase
LSLKTCAYHGLDLCVSQCLRLEAGADLYEISRGLGHSSIATTANVYAHLTDSMRQRVADRMDGNLGSEAG